MQLAGSTLLPMGRPERVPGGVSLDLRVPSAAGRLKLILADGRWTLLSPVVRFSAAGDGPRLIATADCLLTLSAATHPCDLGDGDAILAAFATDYSRATRRQPVEVSHGTVDDMTDALARAARLSGWSLFSSTLHPDDKTGNNPVNLVPPTNPKQHDVREPVISRIFTAILEIFRPTSNAFAVMNGSLQRVPCPIEVLPATADASGHDALDDAATLRRLLVEKGWASGKNLDVLFASVIEEGGV